MDAASHSAGWYWHFSTGGFPSGQVPQGSFSSMGAPGMQPPPQKSNFWTYFIVIGLVLMLICCGCGGAVAWFGYSSVQQVASLAGKELVKPFENDPAFQQHIGNVKSASINFSAMMEEAQKNPNNNNAVTIIDVEGDKGKGQLIGKSVPGEANNQFKEAKLRLPSGEEIPLTAAALGAGDQPGAIEVPAGSSEEPEKEMPAETDAPATEGSSDSAEPAEAASK